MISLHFVRLVFAWLFLAGTVWTVLVLVLSDSIFFSCVLRVFSVVLCDAGDGLVCVVGSVLAVVCWSVVHYHVV